jgi:hypothetical protein
VRDPILIVPVGGDLLVYSLGNLHRNAFDHDTGGHVFPERDQ